MCATDRHDMTLAVKVVLNFNTTKQFDRVQNSYIPASKKRWIYWFSSVHPSVRNQYFPLYFSQQLCITVTSTWYGALARGPTCHYQIQVRQLDTFCFTTYFIFDFPSVTNIFRRTFLSNNVSQPLQTWYGALARGPTCG